MPRPHQTLLIASFLPLCWLWMQVIHEAGHVAAAWATGGTVERVVLHPLTISRTDAGANPHPLVVVWAGPLVGCALPLVFWFVAASLHVAWAYLARFFAGFCFVTNGAYIGGASFERIGDAGEMLRCGSPPVLLWLFAIVTIALGLFLWHRQGSAFGIGPNAAPVKPSHAYACATLLLATLLLEVALSSR